MKTKFVSNVLAALIGACSLVTIAHAQTFKVNGTQGAGATTLEIGPVTGNTFSYTLHGIAAVWKTDPGPAYGATRLPSEDDNPKKDPKGKHDWVLSYAANPAVFAGARQCILKRGADWPGTADLKSLKLDDAKRVACAPITGASGTYQVDIEGDYDILGTVPVIVFKDDSRAWGSHAFGASRSKNSRGLTITLNLVERDASNKPTKVTMPTAAAKKFFAGSFE
ncbi:MAG: hypothetical protein KBD27_00965 [Candidatus Moranbacteria bacterium]|nr:hypothetical protein [Candidatus Moranbacteria bacterium]